MAQNKDPLIASAERALAMLDEGRLRDQRLIDLLSKVSSEAKLRSNARASNAPGHDYWQELADTAMRLGTTLAAYKRKKYPKKPTNILTEQIDAFRTAVTDASADLE
jgi:hypothetical protein